MHFKAVSNDQRKLDLNWDAINTYLSRWIPGTPFDIEIKCKQKTVSDPMRRYYFAAVLPPFMEHLGYDPDEQVLFHRQLKIVFFQIEPDDKGIYRKVPSVFGNDSELGMDVKKRFIEWVMRKAALEGVYIEPTGGGN